MTKRIAGVGPSISNVLSKQPQRYLPLFRTPRSELAPTKMPWFSHWECVRLQLQHDDILSTSNRLRRDNFAVHAILLPDALGRVMLETPNQGLRLPPDARICSLFGLYSALVSI